MVIRDDFDLKSKTYIKIENELQWPDSGTWWGKTRYNGGVGQPIELGRC